MVEAYIDQRLVHLRQLSGLNVISRTDEKGTFYQFEHNGRSVYTTYSYKKVKTFALGVAYGRYCAQTLGI